MQAARAADGALDTADETLLQQIAALGEINLSRALHRAERLDQIERALSGLIHTDQARGPLRQDYGFSYRARRGGEGSAAVHGHLRSRIKVWRRLPAFLKSFVKLPAPGAAEIEFMGGHSGRTLLRESL